MCLYLRVPMWIGLDKIADILSDCVSRLIEMSFVLFVMICGSSECEKKV